MNKSYIEQYLNYLISTPILLPEVHVELNYNERDDEGFIYTHPPQRFIKSPFSAQVIQFSAVETFETKGGIEYFRSEIYFPKKVIVFFVQDPVYVLDLIAGKFYDEGKDLSSSTLMVYFEGNDPVLTWVYNQYQHSFYKNKISTYLEEATKSHKLAKAHNKQRLDGSPFSELNKALVSYQEKILLTTKQLHMCFECNLLTDLWVCPFCSSRQVSSPVRSLDLVKNIPSKVQRGFDRGLFNKISLERIRSLSLTIN